MLHVTTDATFTQDIASGLVLVDFWAEWCGPCKVMLPRLEELAAKHEGTVKICKMDVEDNAATPPQFRIMAIPTMILFKDGQMVEKITGVREIAEMDAVFAKHAA